LEDAVKTQLAALTLAFAAACSPAGVTPGRAQPILLAPTPDARYALDAALARWEAAGVSPGQVSYSVVGAPVFTTPDLIDGGFRDEAGAVRWCDGLTTRDGGRKLLSVQVWAEASAEVWAHELGHALGVRGHTDTGLMRSGAAEKIDAASLEAVCAVAECDFFQPEGG
jgi:predicted Zn-dependent protease